MEQAINLIEDISWKIHDSILLILHGTCFALSLHLYFCLVRRFSIRSKWTGFFPLSEYIMQKVIVTRKLTPEKLISYPFSFGITFSSNLLLFSLTLNLWKSVEQFSSFSQLQGWTFPFIIDFTPFSVVFSKRGTRKCTAIFSLHHSHSYILDLLTFIIVLYKKSFPTPKFVFW